MLGPKMNMRLGICPLCKLPVNLNDHFCGLTLGKMDMNKELVKIDSEECVLIPLTLVMDLYAMAIIADNKQVIEGLKKAIKGEK